VIKKLVKFKKHSKGVGITYIINGTFQFTALLVPLAIIVSVVLRAFESIMFQELSKK